MPPGGLAPMRGAPAAGASPSDGITVSGVGNLDVAATKAVTTFHISSMKPFTLDDIKPLLDDVARADGSAGHVSLPPYANWIGPMRTFSATGTVDNPTAQMLASAIPIIAAAFAKSPGITLDNGSVTLTVANCETFIDRARSEAIHDARRRADAIARDLGVTVGAVKAISSIDQPQGPAGECQAGYYVPSGFGNEGPASLDDYVTVHVVEHVTVRYAIR